MQNNSFERAMGSIVAQAEAERQKEIKAAERAEWFGRARSAFGIFFVATILIFAFNFHDKLGELVATVMPSKAGSAGAESTAGKAAVSLQGAAQNAAARDNLVDSLAK